jgi:hypothetical protein
LLSRRTIVIAAAAVAVALAAGAAAGWLTVGDTTSNELPAQPANPVSVQCPPVSGPTWVFPANVRMSSSRYEAFTVSFSCAKAASYVEKLAGLTLPDKTSGDESPVSGVPGFDCVAYPDKNGHAYGGSCRRGAIEFGWNWNVLYRATEVTQSGEKAKTSTSEYSAVLRPLGHGEYQLRVANTSGIGSIDSFLWAPPPGLRIADLTSAAGARCRLQSSGSISCAGGLRPPTCLCRGDGGSVTIDFSAAGLRPSATSGRRMSVAPEGRLVITAMTPVARLVPSTPGEERNQKGL